MIRAAHARTGTTPITDGSDHPWRRDTIEVMGCPFGRSFGVRGAIERIKIVSIDQ